MAKKRKVPVAFQTRNVPRGVARKSNRLRKRIRITRR